MSRQAIIYDVTLSEFERRLCRGYQYNELKHITKHDDKITEIKVYHAGCAVIYSTRLFVIINF